jgi:hypothetical protein
MVLPTLAFSRVGSASCLFAAALRCVLRWVFAPGTQRHVDNDVDKSANAKHKAGGNDKGFKGWHVFLERLQLRLASQSLGAKDPHVFFLALSSSNLSQIASFVSSLTVTRFARSFASFHLAFNSTTSMPFMNFQSDVLMVHFVGASKSF